MNSGEYKIEAEGKPIASPIYESLKQELDKAVNKGDGNVFSSSLAYAFEDDEETD